MYTSVCVCVFMCVCVRTIHYTVPCKQTTLIKHSFPQYVHRLTLLRLLYYHQSTIQQHLC